MEIGSKLCIDGLRYCKQIFVVESDRENWLKNFTRKMPQLKDFHDLEKLRFCIERKGHEIVGEFGQVEKDFFYNENMIEFSADRDAFSLL